MITLSKYIEFSTNHVTGIIEYDENYKLYLILTENAMLNVSYNVIDKFAYSYVPLPISSAPTCYFQYFSQRNLDSDFGNYSIMFEKNTEKYTQSAYDNLHIVHCNWLPQSAYSTAMTLMVNEQYIQFINTSGTFNMYVLLIVGYLQQLIAILILIIFPYIVHSTTAYLTHHTLTYPLLTHSVSLIDLVSCVDIVNKVLVLSLVLPTVIIARASIYFLSYLLQ